VPFGITAERGTAFYQTLLSSLNAMPDVVAATIGWNPPFAIGRNLMSDPAQGTAAIPINSTAAAPRFFETHGVRVVAGREFDDSVDDRRRAVIVNAALADTLWPRESAIGRTVLYGSEQRVVVGVVAEGQCNDLLGEPHPCAWRPFPMGSSSGYLRIRTRGAPMDFVPSLRQLVHDLNPDVAVAEEISLAGWVRELTASFRISAWISAALAVLCLALVVIGCVSLFLSMVRDSVREIAIRMALGASHVALTTRIVVQGAAVTVAGIIVGTGGAFVVSRQIQYQLYRIEPTDPLTFVAIPILILCIGLVSMCWPALLATRTDPAACLRSE
jgi:hypothetical protein